LTRGEPSHDVDQDDRVLGVEGSTAQGRGRRAALYPAEYEKPTGLTDEAGTIVAAHSLIPDAVFHAFATLAVLMTPDLPLSRRQHEMINTVVSALNRCHY
jgi:hypothetical protein